MRHRRRLPSLLLALLLVGGPAGAAESPAAPPVVVELFTSQGCASCPPADAYLGELAARKDVIALAYHVDYWNYIGWTDPFASHEMTARQKAYARSLNQRYVYTPEMVIDGAHHEVGSDREAIEHLIAAARKAQSAGPAVALSLKNETLAVHVAAVNRPDPGEAAVWLVKFDREHTTRVVHGENRGHTLTDYQVVRTLHRLATWSGAALDLTVDLRSSGPGDGGCAVLVQGEDGAGPIIAAAMIDYPLDGD